jgi:hypothetical protein
LQNHGNGDETFFRNVRVRELTPPAITLSGVTDGASYGDSTSVTPVFAATDTESGVASVTATLDGKPVTSGTAIDLAPLPLGSHQLVVTARDKAGNTATKSVSFTTTTSAADVRALVTRYRDAGRIRPDDAKALLDMLGQYERAVAAKDRNRAVQAMTLFKGHANRKVRDAGVRAILIRDADALIAQAPR